MYLTLLSDILKCKFIENLDEPRINGIRRLTLTQKHKLLFAMIECHDDLELKKIADRLKCLYRLEGITFFAGTSDSYEKKPEKDVFELAENAPSHTKKRVDDFCLSFGVMRPNIHVGTPLADEALIVKPATYIPSYSGGAMTATTATTLVVAAGNNCGKEDEKKGPKK